MDYQKVINQYKSMQIETSNPGKLVIMLYEAAIKNINTAIENMNYKSYDKVNTVLSKASDIINELLISLDEKKGKDIAKNLKSLYVYILGVIQESNKKKEIGDLPAIKDMLTEILSSWEVIVNRTDPKNNQSLNKNNFSISG